MERIIQHIEEYIPPLNIYIDDIEEILEVIRKAGIQEVFISADQYSLDNYTELLKFNKPYINNLEIYMHNPYISISFQRDSARLYAEEDNVLEHGIITKVKLILLKKKKTFHFLTKIGPAVSGFVGGVGFGILFWLVLLGFSMALFVTGSMFILVAITVNRYFKQIRWKNYSTIYLTKREYTPNIFVRNKDNLFVAIIAAVTGSIITLIIQSFI